MKIVAPIIIATALLASCAHNDSPAPVGHGGICVTQPDSQKCQDGTIGGAKS